MTVSIDNEKIRKVILQHYLQPVCHYDSDKFEYDYFFSNERRLKNACMDKVNIYLKLANDCVAKIGFNGTACAITSACADIWCELIINKEIEKIKKVWLNFESMLTRRRL